MGRGSWCWVLVAFRGWALGSHRHWWLALVAIGEPVGARHFVSVVMLDARRFSWVGAGPSSVVVLGPRGFRGWVLGSRRH